MRKNQQPSVTIRLSCGHERGVFGRTLDQRLLAPGDYLYCPTCQTEVEWKG